VLKRSTDSGADAGTGGLCALSGVRGLRPGYTRPVDGDATGIFP
jgi:hypothetical protein